MNSVRITVYMYNLAQEHDKPDERNELINAIKAGEYEMLGDDGISIQYGISECDYLYLKMKYKYIIKFYCVVHFE